MANTVDGANRQFAYNKFVEGLDVLLKEKDSFEDEYPEFKWISVKYPTDRSFRIITLQLIDSEKLHHYSGYIQLADGTLFKLNDVRKKNMDMEFEQMNVDEWYGALYYNIMQFEREGDSYYILFGYDGYKSSKKRKLLDVLTFEDGVPVFGAELIKEKRDGVRDLLRSRLILEYSGDANVNLNFNPGLNAVVHDFLTPRMDFNNNDEVSMVPDGTYVAYEWDGSYLTKIDMLPTETTNPEDIFFRPKPKDNKDLFGKEKKPSTKKRRN